MFSNNFAPRLPEGELAPEIGVGHSVYASGEKAALTIFGAFGAIPGLQSQETRQRTKESVDAIEETLNHPTMGTGQKVLNWVGSTAVYGIATAPLALGAEAAIAGVIGRSAIALAPSLPTSVINFARTPLSQLVKSPLSEYLPETAIGAVAKGTVGFSAGYKAAVFPEHLFETYNAKSDTYNLKNAAQETLNDNFGLYIAAPIFAFGMIAGRAIRNAKSNAAAESTSKSLRDEVEINRAERNLDIKDALQNVKEIASYDKKEAEILKSLESQVKLGQATQHDLDFFKLYVEHPDNPELMPIAHRVLDEQQVPFDRINGRVWSKILETDDISHLKQSIGDEIASQSADYQKAISEFILKNRMDQKRSEMNSKSALKDGLDGYVHYVGKKIAGKEKRLSDLDNVIDKHVKKGLRKSEVISQKKIYQHLKKKGRFNQSEIPFMVPENVAYKLKLRNKLMDLQSGKSRRFKEWFKEDAITKVKEEMKAIKFKPQAKELLDLKEKILKKINNNYKKTESYHRLLDLAEVHPQAEIVLRRIAEEAELVKHEAMATFINHLTNFVDSEVGRLAKPENVINYMKERLEQLVPKSKSIKNVQNEMEDSIKNTVKQLKNNKTDDAILNDQIKKVKKANAELLTEDFNKEKEKYEQFKEKEEDFDQLINCARGFING